jgi:dihydrofolate reductase
MNAIVCIDSKNGIGMKGELLYRIPEDLKRFKLKTSSGECNVVIMGRKTYENIGKPLPGRINIVMTTKKYKIPGVITSQNVLSTMKMLNGLSNCNIDDNVFVIGGSEIYSLFEDYIKNVYVTRVFKYKLCDTTFPIPENYVMTNCTSIFEYKKIKYRYEKYLNASPQI